MVEIAKKHNLTLETQNTFQTIAADLASVHLQIFDVLVFQYFQAPAFHSDPHAGNILITPDGALVLIDNGSIGETKQTDRNKLKEFFLGFALKQPAKLRIAIGSLTQGLEEKHLAAVVKVAQGSLSDADKMNQILAIVTEQAKKIDPAFNKFLKSFATGAYLMSGLKPADVHAVLGAHMQGDSGSLRSYVATAVARVTHKNP